MLRKLDEVPGSCELCRMALAVGSLLDCLETSVARIWHGLRESAPQFSHILNRHSSHGGLLHHRSVDHEGHVLEAHVVHLYDVLDRVSDHLCHGIKALVMHGNYSVGFHIFHLGHVLDRHGSHAGNVLNRKFFCLRDILN